MADILQKTEEVLKLFKNIIESETVKNLPPNGIKTLNSSFENAQNLVKELNFINENVIDLTKFDGDQQSRSNIQTYWDNLPDGAIKIKTDQYQGLKNLSSTIKEFYRAAIDISEIVKFNKAELALSQDMVRDFKKIERSWADLKKAISQSKSEFDTIARHYPNMYELFEMLKKHSVILDYQTGIYIYSKQKWEQIDPKRVSFLKNPNTKMKFIYTFDWRYKNLITGRWFEAHVYQTLSDQFRRLGVDYEIYPLVTYSSTANAKLSQGEIDVLARVGKKFIFVECKSGRILNERANLTRGIIENREKVREICNATRINDYSFMLVFNSLANDPNNTKKEFEGKDVLTIEITDLRGKIIDFVRDLNI